jgi:hypothetical protein
MMARDGTRSLRSTALRLGSVRISKQYALTAILVVALPVLCTGTVSAQSGSDPGTAFCDTDMAGTIQNLFTIIQFGGPLVGGVLALGATVAMPIVRRSDRKKGLRAVQMQGLLWGVIVAPLGTEIVQFILNNVVVGGTSCGF